MTTDQTIMNSSMPALLGSLTGLGGLLAGLHFSSLVELSPATIGVVCAVWAALSAALWDHPIIQSPGHSQP